MVIESEIKKIVDIDEVYGGEGASSFGSYNYINNQIQIMKSDEIYNGVIKDEERKRKITKLLNTIPEGYFQSKIEAITTKIIKLTINFCLFIQ